MRCFSTARNQVALATVESVKPISVRCAYRFCRPIGCLINVLERAWRGALEVSGEGIAWGAALQHRSYQVALATVESVKPISVRCAYRFCRPIGCLINVLERAWPGALEVSGEGIAWSAVLQHRSYQVALAIVELFKSNGTGHLLSFDA